MARLGTTLAAFTGLLAISTVAPAAVLLTATLTNSQEVPPVTPTTATGQPRSSSGTATFSLNDSLTALAFSVTLNGIDVTGSQTADLNDNLVAAHIHIAAPGANGPVRFGFIGSPFNDTTPTQTTVTPFANGVGGIIISQWDAPEGNGTTLGAQVSNILAGLAYINFHTTQFPGGEVRGQITAVPEPSSIGLVLAGGVVFVLLRRR